MAFAGERYRIGIATRGFRGGAGGGCKDFASYQRLCGVIEGLPFSFLLFLA